MTDVQTEAPKKARNVQNFYVAADGTRSPSPQPDCVAIGKLFLESKQEIKYNLDDLPDSSKIQAMAFGLQQVGQNAYGAAASEAERIEMFEARMEAIFGGNWSSDRQVGPRDSDLLEAFAQATADAGKAVDQDWRDRAAAKLKSGEISKKTLSERPAVRAKLEAIRAKRAAERAAQAQAELKGAAKDDLSDIEV